MWPVSTLSGIIIGLAINTPQGKQIVSQIGKNILDALKQKSYPQEQAYYIADSDPKEDNDASA